MCAVSAVGDNWRITQPITWPIINTTPNVYPPVHNTPSRQEFEALKKEIEELKKLLQAAKAYDEATGQKDCEIDEKVELIKRVAKYVGVDLKDVFE